MTLLWAKEGINVGSKFLFLGEGRGACGGFLVVLLGALLLAFLRKETCLWYPLGGVWLTCSLTHFFADGFVWAGQHESSKM